MKAYILDHLRSCAVVLIGKGLGDISPAPSPTSDFNGGR